MKQISAGIFGTGRTELMVASGKLSTVLYGTSEACVRLVVVAPATTGTGLVISNKCAAQAAIQATRCYQFGIAHKPLIGGHDHRLIVWLLNSAMAFA